MSFARSPHSANVVDRLTRPFSATPVPSSEDDPMRSFDNTASFGDRQVSRHASRHPPLLVVCRGNTHISIHETYVNLFGKHSLYVFHLCLFYAPDDHVLYTALLSGDERGRLHELNEHLHCLEFRNAWSWSASKLCSQGAYNHSFLLHQRSGSLVFGRQGEEAGSVPGLHESSGAHCGEEAAAR